MLETQFKLIKMIKGDVLTQITKNSKDFSLSLFLRLALIIFFFFLLNHLKPFICTWKDNYQQMLSYFFFAFSAEKLTSFHSLQ